MWYYLLEKINNKRIKLRRIKQLSQAEIFNKLYMEYSARYLIPYDKIVQIINQALTKTYNSKLPIIINEHHNITITEIINGYYSTKTIVISAQKEKQFVKNLNELIILNRIKHYAKTLKHITKETDNMLYAKPLKFDEDNQLIFQIYNYRKQKIDNFFSIVKAQDLCMIEYKLDKFYLISPTKNFYPQEKNGKYFIYSRSKDLSIIRVSCCSN